MRVHPQRVTSFHCEGVGSEDSIPESIRFDKVCGNICKKREYLNNRCSLFVWYIKVSCAGFRHSSSLRTAMKASVGSWTVPRVRIFFLPSFCFSNSFFFRLMSPP